MSFLTHLHSLLLGGVRQTHLGAQLACHGVCICVCVDEREREEKDAEKRERQRNRLKGTKKQRTGNREMAR